MSGSDLSGYLGAYIQGWRDSVYLSGQGKCDVDELFWNSATLGSSNAELQHKR